MTLQLLDQTGYLANTNGAEETRRVTTPRTQSTTQGYTVWSLSRAHSRPRRPGRPNVGKGSARGLSSPLGRKIKLVVLVLVLSLGTWWFFQSEGFPLGADTTSVVVLFYFILVFGIEALITMLRQKWGHNGQNR